MTQKISIIILASVVVLVSAVLSGCGSSSPSNVTASNFAGVLTTANTGGTAAYGTLTLSGTGTALTGTTFGAKFAQSGITLGSPVYGWYNISNATTTPTYPLDFIVVGQNASGSVMSVGFYHYTNATSFTGYWLAIATTTASGAVVPVPGLTISTTARTATFNQVTLSSTILSPTSTSVILNGTLKY